MPKARCFAGRRSIYALHAFSLLTGILGAATVIGAFLTGWPSIIAVILNYVKRSEARGTWLESHFRWQIRTFWFGVLWVSLCVRSSSLTLGLGLLVAWLPLGLVGLWFIYRDRARMDGAQRPTADVSMNVASGPETRRLGGQALSSRLPA